MSLLKFLGENYQAHKPKSRFGDTTVSIAEVLRIAPERGRIGTRVSDSPTREQTADQPDSEHQGLNGS
jgi:hypothetical protein